MRPLYSTAQLRTIEHAAMALLPAGTLMQRAGAAASQLAISLLDVPIASAQILIIAGPGNNGGDALVVADHLAKAGALVTVKLCADPARLPADAKQAWQRAAANPIKFVDQLPHHDWSLVIDGLFGIGLTRPIDGALRELIDVVNRIDCPRIALDIPSGLNADTGNVVGNVVGNFLGELIGNDGIAFCASHTITFIGDKPGLHTAAGQDYAGIVSVTDLAIDARHFVATPTQFASPALFVDALQVRKHDSHKGSYGDVLVLGGDDGMAGAVLLAAKAALYAGSGRVYAAFVGNAPTHDAQQPELMCRSAADLDFGKSVIVAGPGLGTSEKSYAVLSNALQQANATVLDADALNLIAAHPALQTLVAHHAPSILLTPHPLEAARLLGCSAAVIQADRITAATMLAQRYRATVILKGSGTVIARVDGTVVINSTGNPALATGGSGDVLAGLCGALLAQGWPVWQAAIGAVWLHGRAADTLVAQGCGPIGLTASELPAAIRQALNVLRKAS